MSHATYVIYQKISPNFNLIEFRTDATPNLDRWIDFVRENTLLKKLIQYGGVAINNLKFSKMVKKNFEFKFGRS